MMSHRMRYRRGNRTCSGGQLMRGPTAGKYSLRRTSPPKGSFAWDSLSAA